MAPSEAEETNGRFKMFVAVLRDEVEQIKANALEEPVLRSPSDLLDYIADELTNRAPFRSRANAEYVQAEAHRIVRDDPLVTSDPVLTKAFTDLANAAATALNNNSAMRTKTAGATLAASLASATTLIGTGYYFDKVVARLIQQICDAPVGTVTYDDLLWSTRSLVSAYLEADFSIEHIKWFAIYLNDVVVEHDGELHFQLPVEVPMRPYLSGTHFDREAYKAARRTAIEAYTIRQRLNALSVWYREPSQQYKVIARVNGLRGHRDLRLGDVLLYMATAGVQRFITCKSDPVHQQSDEMFGDPGGMNGAVTVSARDIQAAERTGLDLIAEALDVLGSQISHEVALAVHRGRIEVADIHGHMRGGNYGFDPAAPAPNDAFLLNLDHLFAQTMSRLTDLSDRVIATSGDRDRGRLKDALRGLRRSFEAIRPEDQLLEAWMVLEALLGDDVGLQLTLAGTVLTVTEIRVAAVAAAIALSDFRFGVAVSAYYDVRRAVVNQRFNHHKNAVAAPDTLLEALGLIGTSPDPKAVIQVAKDVQTIRPFILDPLLSAKVERESTFYGDATVAHLRLAALSFDVQAEIAIIYQQRNRFVHQARRRLELISYYAARARRYATQVLELILSASPQSSHETTFQTAIDMSQRLLTDVATGNVAALLGP